MCYKACLRVGALVMVGAVVLCTTVDARADKIIPGVANSRLKGARVHHARLRGDPWQPKVMPAGKVSTKKLRTLQIKSRRRQLNSALKGAAVAKRRGNSIELIPGKSIRGTVKLNGQKLTQPALLKAGDRIELRKIEPVYLLKETKNRGDGIGDLSPFINVQTKNISFGDKGVLVMTPQPK